MLFSSTVNNLAPNVPTDTLSKHAVSRNHATHANEKIKYANI